MGEALEMRSNETNLTDTKDLLLQSESLTLW